MTEDEVRQDLIQKFRAQYYACAKAERYEESAVWEHAIVIVSGSFMGGDEILYEV